MPERIQRKRQLGWRMPANAVYVGRPSKWGNPYRWSDYPALVVPLNVDGDNEPKYVPEAQRRSYAATDFESAVRFDPRTLPHYPSHDEIRRELAGKDLVCWCSLDEPCHADVLLEIANSGEAPHVQ